MGPFLYVHLTLYMPTQLTDLLPSLSASCKLKNSSVTDRKHLTNRVIPNQDVSIYYQSISNFIPEYYIYINDLFKAINVQQLSLALI